MPRMLGISSPPGLIDDVIVPPERYGVRLISMGFFAREDQAVIWRGPMLHKALEQFLTDVYWGDTDYLVIDMPPGTGDVPLSISQFLPRAEVIVVTTPQPAAQRVAQRAAAMAEKVDLDVIGVIENMSWFVGDDGKRYELFGSAEGEELAAKLGVPLLGKVPLVPELREGGDDGRPIVIAEPDDEASQAFRAIAEQLDTDARAQAHLQPRVAAQLTVAVPSVHATSSSNDIAAPRAVAASYPSSPSASELLPAPARGGEPRNRAGDGAERPGNGPSDRRGHLASPNDAQHLDAVVERTTRTGMSPLSWPQMIASCNAAHAPADVAVLRVDQCLDRQHHRIHHRVRTARTRAMLSSSSGSATCGSGAPPRARSRRARSPSPSDAPTPGPRAPPRTRRLAQTQGCGRPRAPSRAGR